MYQDRVVLCGANSYEEKYYLNPDFEQLPQSISKVQRNAGGDDRPYILFPYFVGASIARPQLF